MHQSPSYVRYVRRYALFCALFFLLLTRFAPAADSTAAAPLSEERNAQNLGGAESSFVPLSLHENEGEKGAALETAADAEDEGLAQILADGKKLLGEKNWAEAKIHFESALRKHPEYRELGPYYLKSRAHLEIESRYADESFCGFLADTDKDEILQLCAEVLNNIEAWHVDAPDWRALFQMGMDSFAVALSEDAFLRQNRVPDAYREKLLPYAESLIEYSRSFHIVSRTDLSAGMLKIAETVQQNTGISGIAVIMEILCGMVNSLDAYSAYLTRGQINDIYSMIDGHFVGLGVYIEIDAPHEAMLITKVIPGSPAYESGLTGGDRILAVDGRPISRFDTPESAGALLQGPEGSRIALRIQSGGLEPRDVEIVRRTFDVPSVEDVRLIDSAERKIGYFRINTFQKTTVDEVRRETAALMERGISCLIIDLRNNPGGLLDKAVDLSNLFLENGTIVRTRGRMNERIERADAREVCRVPLILLIDENSASAAEIFAGAIQENGRGLIVGAQSFGKGTVQAIIQLGSRRRSELIAGLRLTTEKFYSPRGRSYSGVGVLPDVAVENEYAVARPLDEESTAAAVADGTNPDDDPCLRAALRQADSIAARRGSIPAPSLPRENASAMLPVSLERN